MNKLDILFKHLQETACDQVDNVCSKCPFKRNDYCCIRVVANEIADDDLLVDTLAANVEYTYSLYDEVNIFLHED